MKLLNIDYENTNKYLKKIWIFLLILICSFLTFIYFQFTVDDAYITFRHSLNFVQARELSWNITGPREEAFTNFLYVPIAALSIKLGYKPELLIKLMSFGIFFLWLYRLNLISKETSKEKQLIVSTIYICCIPIYIHTYSGLETILYSYLLFEFLCTESYYSFRALSISLLITLTRPEGALMVGLVLANFFLYITKGIKISCNSNKRWFLPTLFIVFLFLILYIFKINYFGYLLPNTFFSKSVNSTNYSVFFSNVKDSFPWASLAFSCVIFRKNSKNEYLKLLPFLVIYIVYLQSRLTMNYSDRFWFQLFWPVITYSIVSNPKIFDFKDNVNFSIKNIITILRKIRYSIFSILGIFWLITQTMYISPSEFIRYSAGMGRLIRSHARLGLSLNKSLPNNASIYLGDAGLIAYYSNRLTYDLWGLGTREIAKNGISNNFLEQVSPDIFILYASECTIKGNNNEKNIEFSFIREKNYKFLGGFRNRKELCLNLYSKSEIYENIASNIFFQKSLKNSKINNRSDLEGLVEDIKLSYKYLLTKQNIHP